MFFKKILMPCGLCAVPVLKPASTSEDRMPRSDEPGVRKLIRPSELPIYSFEDDYSKQSPCTECPPSALEQSVSKIRRSIQAAASGYQRYTGVVSDTIDIGFEHSRSLLDYLREESNVMPRMGAIAIGGIAGLVLGLRGRRFKRIVYSSAGALSMAAVCYPKKAEEGFDMAKHYANVGYNFIYGAYANIGGDKTKHVTFRNTEEVSAPILETPSVPLADKNTDARGEVGLDGSKFRKTNQQPN
ncbi:PREDICTED: MICOS complex subunit Mic27 isoform X3 [Vollenhovia emeryi]|uniref:MICOS complex subunit Mic27 isoform X3 n=1 Tax=Vollenhovia emeryi TaxID=411798 RepID=UPI0005F46D72|nr:PREDICTED: MICOS complex subunit Mic27 isoform X3 [Vollenhovia emeryi]